MTGTEFGAGNDFYKSKEYQDRLDSIETATRVAKELLDWLAPDDVTFSEDSLRKDLEEGTGMIIGPYEINIDETGNITIGVDFVGDYYPPTIRLSGSDSENQSEKNTKGKFDSLKKSRQELEAHLQKILAKYKK